MTQRELERSPFIQAKDHVNGAFLGNKIQQNKEAEVYFQNVNHWSLSKRVCMDWTLFQR